MDIMIICHWAILHYYVIQNNCRKVWWCFLMISCTFWRSRKKLLNSPKLSCGFNAALKLHQKQHPLDLFVFLPLLPPTPSSHYLALIFFFLEGGGGGGGGLSLFLFLCQVFICIVYICLLYLWDSWPNWILRWLNTKNTNNFLHYFLCFQIIPYGMFFGFCLLTARSFKWVDDNHSGDLFSLPVSIIVQVVAAAVFIVSVQTLLVSLYSSYTVRHDTKFKDIA